MESIIGISIVVVLFIIGIIFYRWFKEQKRKKRELEEKLAKEKEEKRQKLFDFYKSKLDRIEKAVNLFTKHLDLNIGYFTNYQVTLWKNQHTSLFNELRNRPYENIQLAEDEVTIIMEFQNFYKNAETLRNDFNKQFVKNELKKYNRFFDNIEQRKLDTQQRKAIVTDEDNNIIIAGAGSGKTTTIIGKINYIIDRFNINPEDILLISFTNKSATTLADRIDIEGVEAKTFHKYGKDIIAEVEGKQPSIFDENQFRPLLIKYFNELIRNDRYLRKVTEYFTDFLKPPKSEFDFDNQGDYIQYIKDKNFRTYKLKEIPVKGKTTYKMEVVKSIQECKIANFLLFNNIKYEYELPYEHDTATQAYSQYKPDFTIIQNGRKIYIEHFGISRSGKVPHWFAKKGETQEEAKTKYWEKIYWAREMHESYGTTLIETFSYEMTENILFENLTKNLTDTGIILVPKSPKEIWEIITTAAKDEVNSFIALFQTFITLMKSNDYTINNVVSKNKQTKDDFHRNRNALFIEIIKPIYERYENYLVARKEIDFSDMINKASKYLINGNHNRQFKYVVIDEFQDISIGRYQLVKAIKSNNPVCKLFCVGDDWQSIYRFSGSDIALFKEFENYFGFTVKSKIETTYRFHNPLVNLSSDFIQKNPNQAKKELKGTGLLKSTNHQIKYSVTENQDDTYALKEIFDELINSKRNIEKKEIFILGRYSFDIDRLKNESNIFHIDKKSGAISYTLETEEGEIKQLKAQFLTVHKAKGLEANIVIILNCNSGKHGFPSEMSDDTVLNLLLSEADQFENGEERRLFYVAMTRAKENVYFVADTSYKSKFIAELELESGQSTNEKCPECKTADVVLRKKGIAKNGNKYKFYGCSNFLYGCEYSRMEWDN